MDERRLLILSATRGDGRRGAMALEQGFRAQRPRLWTVRQAPWPAGLAGGPAALERRLPRLGALLFHLLDRPAVARACEGLLARALGRRLGPQVRAFRPDLVIGLHPLLAGPAMAGLGRAGGEALFATVVTDLADGHALWFRGQPQALVVPTRLAADRALRLAVDPCLIHNLGQPVSLDLLDAPPPPSEARRRLGLEPDLPLVLLVGPTGEGSAALRAALAALPTAHQLLDLTDGHDDASRLHAADIVLADAAGGRVMEAAAAGRPQVRHGFLPRRHQGGMNLLEERGMGRYVPRADAAIATVGGWLAEGPHGLAERQARARSAARPRAALDIARLLDDLVEAQA